MELETVCLGGEEVELPTCLLEDFDVFSEVLSEATWTNVLTDEDRTELAALLPKTKSTSQQDKSHCQADETLAKSTPQTDSALSKASSETDGTLSLKSGDSVQTSVVHSSSAQTIAASRAEVDGSKSVSQVDYDALGLLFSGDNVRFGNPLHQLWDKLNSGSLSPDVVASQEQLKQLKYHQYELSEQARYVGMLRELLLSRQHLLQEALFTGALDTLPSNKGTQKDGHKKERSKFARLLCEIRKECDQNSDYISSDEEPSTNQIADVSVVTETDYREMLRVYRKRRKSRTKTTCEQAVRALDMKEVPDVSRGVLPRRPKDHVSSSKRVKTEQEVDGAPPIMRQTQRGEGMQMDADTSRAVYDVYKTLDQAGSAVNSLMSPLRINGPLPTGKFMSFFSLIKHIFRDILDGKGELSKLVKNVRHALKSPEVSSCVWVRRQREWPPLTLSAICYLAAEVGAVSSFSPLHHFVPLIEFRDRIDHWKWIGAGRDNDVELHILCDHWLENLDKVLPVVDYSEYEPPPPHVWTNFTFRPSTPKEIAKFRQLERERYASPQKSFTYSVHGFEAPVGPVKGSRATRKEASSKARGHALLIPQRPTCVTILSLVRDATSRLPNGEGTRIDLCVLVQDSQYLSDNVSDTQLNNAVSGALDRLHYEKDPCVRYDGSRKVWIYLHRGRNEEDFERIFWVCEVAANQRKRLMSKSRVKPRVIMSVDGREVVLEQGGGPSPSEEPPSRPAGSKRGGRQTAAAKAAPVHRSVVTATLIPSDGQVKIPLTAKEQSAQSGASKRKRKPTQKVAEQQLEQRAKKMPPPLTALPTTSLQSSDWGSSDEEQVLPFLDSSLVSEDKLSQGSGSSWHTSDSGGEEPVVIATETNPTFNTSNSQLTSGLLQSSPVVTTPTFINEPTGGGPAHFVPLTPTQNYLPGTPTVAMPTFIPDIGMEDEGDVLSQQFGGDRGDKQTWLSSGSVTPE